MARAVSAVFQISAIGDAVLCERRVRVRKKSLVYAKNHIDCAVSYGVCTRENPFKKTVAVSNKKSGVISPLIIFKPGESK